MVIKRRKYANGGQVTDHMEDYHRTDYKFPKPSYLGAVKDRIKGAFSGGAAGKAAKTIKESESMRERQIREAGG